jgi:tRNA dimethylallyltransferase
MSKQKHLIVIQGPTACGKTALSIALAKELNTEIVSADSRQFYKEISIGTAKPSLEEQDGVPHHFISSHSIQEPVTAAQFEKEALVVIEDLFKTKDTVILVGGSGLFVDALCYGLDPLPADKSIQEKYKKLLDEKGISFLQQELNTKDPVYTAEVDLENPHRVIRALEIIELTGKTMKEVRTNKKQIRSFEIHRFVIDMERQKLYDRIDERVLQMMTDGLMDEALAVQEFSHLQSLNTVGYKELYAFFNGDLPQDEAIALIQQNSRRYAKRQLTWLRRDDDNQWLTSESTEDRLIEIKKELQEKQIIS